MTTIVLTIIGILLAAAAALMVVYYGGDAFNGGDAKAQAATLMNAGTNVVAAYDLHRAQTGVEATGVSDLISSSSLASKPSLEGLGTAGDAWTVERSHGGGADVRTYAVTGVSDAVCTRVNASLGTVGILALQRGRMGCYRPQISTGNVFYAVVSGPTSGFNEWTAADGGFVGMRVSTSLSFYDGAVSRNGKASLVLQGDGNLCLYTKPGSPYGSWCNSVYDYGSSAVLTFTDGLWTLRNPSGVVLWQKGEAGHPGSSVVLLDEGRVQIRTPDQQVLWSNQ